MVFTAVALSPSHPKYTTDNFVKNFKSSFKKILFNNYGYLLKEVVFVQLKSGLKWSRDGTKSRQLYSHENSNLVTSWKSALP